MRAGLLTLAAACAYLGGCAPDIGAGTYYCGPERFCPPDLACDDPTFTCERPGSAASFACPDGSQGAEPDDTIGTGEELGELDCGLPILDQHVGCLDDDDVDHIGFVLDGTCVGEDPHLEVSLRFPVALMPLSVDLLDTGGDVIAEGVPCTPSGDATGTDRVCLDRRIEPGHYLLRVRMVDDAPDCDGECRHNQYQLDVGYPLS
jgi:hypothetical protein